MASTATIQPAWTLQSQDTAAVGRLHDGAFLQSLTTVPATQFRPGVIPTVATNPNTTAVDLFTQQAGSPNMTVLVSAGYAVVANSAGRGPYICGNTATQTLTVATADPTNPRIDLVYCQVIDTVAGDTGSSTTQVGIVTGTPAATPSVPALPTNGVSIPLSQVAVAANASSITNANITDVRKSVGVGRGPRFLLGGDALTDPGYCYGEIRSRVSSAYLSDATSSILSDYWGFDNKWHGLNSFLIAQPTQAASGSISSGTTVTIASIAIPDPGFAYHIITGGMVDYGSASAGAGLLLSCNVDSAIYNTNAISQGHGSTPFAAVGTDVNLWLPYRSSILATPNGYTGSHTLYFVAQGQGATGTIYNGPGGNGGDKYTWHIQIVPA